MLREGIKGSSRLPPESLPPPPAQASESQLAGASLRQLHDGEGQRLRMTLDQWGGRIKGNNDREFPNMFCFQLGTNVSDVDRGNVVMSLDGGTSEKYMNS